MTLWMTIGYACYEGDAAADGVFTDRDVAVKRILSLAYRNWNVPFEEEEFIRRCDKYMTSHPETEHWYVYPDAKWLRECFPECVDGGGMLQWFGDDYWFGIRRVELDKAKE